MARRKIISDTEVFDAVRALRAAEGDRAASFATVARRSGLAASTLVQRFGTREAMVAAALSAGWDQIDAATERAEAQAGMTVKGAGRLLKSLAEDLATVGFTPDWIRSPRAETWRRRVESALAARLGGGAKAAEAAALLFAAWQGQIQWEPAGGRAFRMKDAVKRLI